MAVLPTDAQPAVHAVRHRPGLALLAALLATVPYVVGLVLPYYLHGVHRRPAGETIYAYELAALWPYDTALGAVVAFVTIVGVPTAPFLAAGVAAWSLFDLWTWRGVLAARQVVLYAAAAAVGVASITWLATPLAGELVMWFLD